MKPHQALSEQASVHLQRKHITDYLACVETIMTIMHKTQGQYFIFGMQNMYRVIYSQKPHDKSKIWITHSFVLFFKSRLITDPVLKNLTESEP